MYRNLLISTALIATLATYVRADSPMAPQIDSSVVNTTANELTITGSHFGTGMPWVTLDGMPLLVLTFTETIVVAQLRPSIIPGSYTLVITQFAKHIRRGHRYQRSAT